MKGQPTDKVKRQPTPKQAAEQVEYLQVRRKVQEEIQDISSIRDEEFSKTLDIDDEGIYSPDKAGDSFYQKRTGDKFYDEPSTEKKRPLNPEP